GHTSMHIEVIRATVVAMTYSPEDIAYIEAEFRTLSALAAGRREPAEDLAALVDAGVLPQPTYVLPDGRRMFSHDLLELYDDAGGAAHMRARFARRYIAAAAELAEGTTADRIEADWRDYLGGGFGACLRAVTPENIYRKERLVARLTRALADPH